MNKTYKVGDIVYCNDLKYSGELGIKMKILEIDQKSHVVDVYKVELLDNIIGGCGIEYVYWDDIFDTEEDAIIQGKKEFNRLITNYKNKIHSVEDLLLYPLKNFDICDEYTDQEAVIAYVEKVKELFNIDLSGKF